MIMFPVFPKHFQANISKTSTQYLDENWIVWLLPSSVCHWKPRIIRNNSVTSLTEPVRSTDHPKWGHKDPRNTSGTGIAWLRLMIVRRAYHILSPYICFNTIYSTVVLKIQIILVQKMQQPHWMGKSVMLWSSQLSHDPQKSKLPWWR